MDLGFADTMAEEEWERLRLLQGTSFERPEKGVKVVHNCTAYNRI
jgi:hypothetical protein